MRPVGWSQTAGHVRLGIVYSLHREKFQEEIPKDQSDAMVFSQHWMATETFKTPFYKIPNQIKSRD